MYVPKNTAFELQLVVIGILIPLYLEILPVLIKPILYPNLSLELPRQVSYILGGFWFICLLFGTFSLIDEEDRLSKKSLQIYQKLFRFNNFATFFILTSIITAYLIFFLILILTPVFHAYTEICLIIILLLILLLTGSQLIKKGGGVEKNGKTKQRKK